MWVSRGEYDRLWDRIRDLESDLKDERAANRRREEWAIDMLMRRGGTFPVPPLKSEQTERPTPARQITETDLAKAEALRQEGQRLGRSPDEINKAIELETGWTEEVIAKAINENGNG